MANKMERLICRIVLQMFIGVKIPGLITPVFLPLLLEM